LGDDRDTSGRLTLSNITAGYGGAPVIVDISLEVGRGEIVVVIGPNGAGKSTMLKAVLGELEITEGTVTLDDEEITGLSTLGIAERGVAYVPQREDVFEPLTVAENLEMGGYCLESRDVKRRRDEVISEYFPALGGMLGRVARQLSGGERKMLAIARALMVRPRVLVLDEPTANLSPDLAISLMETDIRRLASEGTSVLLVEQRVAAALAIADRGYVLVSGRRRLAGTGAELRERDDMGELFLGEGGGAAKGTSAT
jgi:branched-chain amino acid transport system ATP-binding protein